MKKVLIIGWYGSDNLGDELLLEAALNQLAPYVTDVTVLCADAARVERIHGVPAASMIADDVVNKVRDTIRIGRLIRECDLVIIGPGTVLQERSDVLRWPGTLPLLSRLIVMARIHNKPVVLFGTAVRESATPLGRMILRRIGRSASGSGVRDAESAEVLGPPAEVIGDLLSSSSLASRSVGPADRTQGEGFGISGRPLGANTPQLIALLETIISHCGETCGEGVFYQFSAGTSASGEDDHDVFMALRTRSKLRLATVPLQGERPLESGFMDWYSDFAGRRILVATRLHAAMMGVIAGVPTLAIAYEQKVHRLFRDLGLSQFCLPLKHEPAKVIDSVNGLLTESFPFEQARAVLHEHEAAAAEFIKGVMSS